MSGNPPGADEPPASPTSPSASTPTPPATPTPTPPVVRRTRSRGMLIGIVVVVILVVAVLAAGYPLGWYKSKSTAPGKCPTGVSLSGAGASLVLPIITSWAYTWGGSTGDGVNYVGSGAGAGATSFIDRSVDFAATDGPLNASQISQLPYPDLTLPFVGGAVAIIYNLPSVTATLNFSGNVLAGIFNGSIATWNNSALEAINPGVSLPNSPIQTVHRLDAAGTTQVLTDYMARVNAPWKSGPGVGLQISWPTTPTPSKAISGNSKLAQYVNSTSGSLGYVDLADAHAYTHLGIGAVLNPSNQYVVPTSADTETAISSVSASITLPNSTSNWQNVDMVDSTASGAYPLAALAYGFIYQAMDKGYQPSLAKSQVIRSWFDWILTTGQASASSEYYASLPSSIVAVDQTGLSTLTYNGAAIPACS